MNNAEKILKQLEPELLRIFNNSPEYGAVGINAIIHRNQLVRVDSSRTVTMKVTKEVEK